MAVLAKVVTMHGEEKELYVRLNNVEVSNHGVQANALFRGFISREAFDNGFHYVWEREFQFTADVSKPVWEQAYAQLKAEIEVIQDLD
ncbi:hypothetical protein ACPFUK_003332 [Vibrio cholerae]